MNMIVELVALPAVGKTSVFNGVIKRRKDIVNPKIKMNKLKVGYLLLTSKFFWSNLLTIYNLSFKYYSWSFMDILSYISKAELAKRSKKIVLYDEFFFLMFQEQERNFDKEKILKFFKLVCGYFDFRVIYLDCNIDEVIRRAKKRKSRVDKFLLKDAKRLYNERKNLLDKYLTKSKRFIHEMTTINVSDKTLNELVDKVNYLIV